jgi:hypothetical protein
MLKILYLLCTLLLSNVVLANDSACFDSTEAFMVKKYGSAYRDDENFVIRKVRYGKQAYYAASDMTPGHNFPISLLMRRPGRGLCLVLDTPPVATLHALKYDKHGRPLVFVAKDQGTTSREITYTWNRKSETFNPTMCREITWVSDKSVGKIVSCKEIVEW